MLSRHVAALMLACACIVGADAPAAPTAQDLITAGKEAIARYNSDPTVNAGAIVDAAIAFELAHRATADWAETDVVSDIQANLFWCRKQMDAVAMGQYRARIDALPVARRTAAGPPNVVIPQKAARPAVQPTAAPAQAPVDTPIVDAWVQRLQERIRADIAAKREPHFTLASMRSPAIIRDLAGNGMLTLALDGGEMTYPWKLLTAKDLAAIASGLTVGDEHTGHALAAFFQLAAGDVPAGRASLLRAGTMAEEVERAHQAMASR